jgi:hypothetical protein
MIRCGRGVADVEEGVMLEIGQIGEQLRCEQSDAVD